MKATMCPKFTYTATLMSKRWTGFIVMHLMSGAKRFTELQHNINCSAKVLSQRLKELETMALIKKVPCEECAHDAYALTSKGSALKPVLDAMQSWGEAWA